MSYDLLGWVGSVVRAGIDISLATASWGQTFNEMEKRKKPYKPPSLEMQEEYDPKGAYRKTFFKKRNEMIRRYFFVPIAAFVIFTITTGNASQGVAAVLVSLVIGAYVVGIGGRIAAKQEVQRSPALEPSDYQNASAYTIRLPRDEKWDAQRARQLGSVDI